MLRIGSLKFKSNLILAPMSGVTDLPFRMLNRKFGCELAFVEMINARSLGHKSIKTQQLLTTNRQDKPLGIQLLGSEPKYIKRGLDILAKYKFDLLDFNAACPARKVIRRGEGASLLTEPKKLGSALKLLVNNSKVPVTVKIRIGWDKDNINAVEVAKVCQDAGVNAVFVHGRTRLQEYSGKVDYAVIGEVKNNLSIPVIASGDIFSAQLAKKMFDETGCDGILVARGALGNPWIFNQIRHFLQYGTPSDKPDVPTIVETMTHHFQSCVDFYGPRVGVTIFRKFFSWYTKGFHRVRPLREKACRANNEGEMLAVINEINRQNAEYKL